MDNTLPQNAQPELFPGLPKIPQAKRNCRLGCQTDLTDTSHDSKSGGSRPCGVAAPSRPSSHSAQAKENSAAETRPRRAPARLPAPRTPTGRPLSSAPGPPTGTAHHLARSALRPCRWDTLLLHPIRKGGSAFA